MMALQERIEAELQSNPVLELQEPSEEEQVVATPEDDDDVRGEQPMVVDAEKGSEDFQRLDRFVDEFGWDSADSGPPPRRRASTDGERDRKMDAMANAPAPEQSLNECGVERFQGRTSRQQGSADGRGSLRCGKPL